MKKVTKRLAALMMVPCMMASLAGCGSGGGESSANSGNNEVSNSSEAGNSGSEAAENAGGVREFEYFGLIYDPYQESTPIYDALQEATGIKVDFNWNTSDAYSTNLAARLSNKDLPDVIGSGFGADIVLQDLIDDGLIIPLTDLLEEKMPNYMRFINEDDYLYMVNQTDGEVYAFGMVMDVPGSFSYMVRQDWLDRLNLEVPEDNRPNRLCRAICRSYSVRFSYRR